MVLLQCSAPPYRATALQPYAQWESTKPVQNSFLLNVHIFCIIHARNQHLMHISLGTTINL